MHWVCYVISSFMFGSFCEGVPKLLMYLIGSSFTKNWPTDGPWFRWESCIYCCMGCCSVIVHGVARFLHTEVVNCWWFEHSVAHSCRSWGKALFLVLSTSMVCLSLLVHCNLWIIPVSSSSNSTWSSLPHQLGNEINVSCLLPF